MRSEWVKAGGFHDMATGLLVLSHFSVCGSRVLKLQLWLIVHQAASYASYLNAFLHSSDSALTPPATT